MCGMSTPVLADSAKNRHVDDSAITTTVKAKLGADKTLSDSNLNVKTAKGIVVIIGNVKTDDQANAAVEDASSTPGVKDVDSSKLIVEKSNQSLADTTITAKVKGAFLREKIFGDKPISVMGIAVETKNGVVFLTGSVENKAQIKEALKLAKSVKGVKTVKVGLKITDEPRK